ncbi:MAG: S9 family peptidase [Actinobacteria bacterium]|nr:S9 family peptidase [Actinomycetota bacterium]
MTASKRTRVWPSPISAEAVTAGAARPGEVRFSGESIWWSESRPAEGGRVALVRFDPTSGPVDALPPGASARSRVHEYGGGAWDVRGRLVAFVDDSDDGTVKVFTRTGRSTPSPSVVSPPRPVGSGPYADRYADVCIDVIGERVFAVRERHRDDGVHNDVVALPADGSARDDPGSVVVVANGADFYGQLSLSPDARRLAFIRWMLPDMPWDATESVVVDLATGVETVVAGGPGESVVEPNWAPDGSLIVCSDRTGWWNPYRWDPETPGVTPEAIAPVDGEIGGAMWVFGNRSMAWTPDGRIVASMSAHGIDQLVTFDGDGSAPRVLDTPFTHIPQVVTGPDGSALVVAGGPEEFSDVWRVGLSGDSATVTRLGAATDSAFGPGWFARPSSIDVPTDDGAITHAVIYEPCNPQVGATEGLPPLIVLGHGGPTSAARVQLNLSVQFWTSRGFCVADVDYRGSTGFGRDYREALNGRWGIADVTDCAAVARHLADSGIVDADRLGIRGGSAGGFTTLAALCFTDTFTAGMSAYGIADLEVLARDTHKFESRYLDRLVGPWPEAAATYRDRSPIHHLDRLSCPVGVLQGADDAVVPPAQAEAIVAALAAKGIPYATLTFEGEGHGFRRAENIVRALEAELWFFAHAFGLELGEAIDPVPGDGLDGSDGSR